MIHSNGSIIKCKYCSSTFQPAVKNSMIYHLEKVENIKIKNLWSSRNKNQLKKIAQMSIVACLRTKIDPPEVVLATLAAVDLILIFKLEKRVEIKNGWAAQNIKIPSIRHGIKKMLLEYCKKVKSNLMKDFTKLKKDESTL